eukprot:1158174-Pelagomonas_calceolata.AAC.9
MGPPGSCLPACLTSSDGWTLYQEHLGGGPGAGAAVQKTATWTPNFGRENGELELQSSQCSILGS